MGFDRMNLMEFRMVESEKFLRFLQAKAHILAHLHDRVHIQLIYCECALIQK
jgi:hypothetical protein